MARQGEPASTVENVHARKEKGDFLRSGDPEQALNLLQGNRAATIRHQLIEDAQRVAHTAGRCPGYCLGCSVFECDALLDGNLAQMDDRVVHIVAIKGIALTARQNRRRYFVDLGGRQDKHGMVGWLFEGFEQRIERRSRQHVHFVDDVHLVATRHRGVLGVIAKLANIVHRVIRRTVDLDDIHAASLEHVCTRGTLVAWLMVCAIGAIQRSRENACARGLPHTTRPRKHIGMMNPPLTDGIFERRRNMLLSNHIRKPEWSPFSSCDDVTLFF